MPEPMLTNFTDIYAALGGDELMFRPQFHTMAIEANNENNV